MGRGIPGVESVRRRIVKLLGIAMLLMLAFGAGALYNHFGRRKQQDARVKLVIRRNPDDM